MEKDNQPKIFMAVSDITVPLGALIEIEEIKVSNLKGGDSNFDLKKLTYSGWREGEDDLLVQLPELPEKSIFVLVEVDVRGCGMAEDVLKKQGVQVCMAGEEHGRSKAFFLLTLPYRSYNQLKTVRVGGIVPMEIKVSAFGNCLIQFDTSYIWTNWDNRSATQCIEVVVALLNIINDLRKDHTTFVALEETFETLKFSNFQAYDVLHELIAREFIERTNGTGIEDIVKITAKGKRFLESSNKEAVYYYPET